MFNMHWMSQDYCCVDSRNRREAKVVSPSPTLPRAAMHRKRRAWTEAKRRYASLHPMLGVRLAAFRQRNHSRLENHRWAPAPIEQQPRIRGACSL